MTGPRVKAITMHQMKVLTPTEVITEAGTQPRAAWLSILCSLLPQSLGLFCKCFLFRLSALKIHKMDVRRSQTFPTNATRWWTSEAV